MTASFETLYLAARDAAAKAAAEQDAALGPESSRGLDCGFAWVQFPGTGAFAKWAKNYTPAGSNRPLASKHWHRGLYIWAGSLHDVSTQSITVHEAAAREFSRVLRDAGIDASTGSRLD